MRRSNRTTFGGGSGHTSHRHGQGPRRGERSTQRTLGPFNSYDQGSNMESGMVLYDSSDEDRDMEGDLTHRSSGIQEDLYRQSLHEYGSHRHQHQLRLTSNSRYESDEDVELARRSGGNEYGPHRARTSRSDLVHSGPIRRPPTRHGPTNSGHNNFQEGRPRLDGQPVPGPRSNRELRDARSDRAPSIDPRGFLPYEERGTEWWAEENRSARQSNQTTLGIWTEGDDPQGDPIFVPNPTLDASYASRIERHRDFILRR